MLFKRENKLQVLILTFEQCPSDGGINLMVSILKSQHASHCSKCIPCVLLLPLSHTVNLATMRKLQEETWFSVNTNAAEPPCINSQHQWKSMPSPSEQLLAACLSPRRPPALQKSTKCTTHQHCQHCHFSEPSGGRWHGAGCFVWPSLKVILSYAPPVEEAAIASPAMSICCESPELARWEHRN